MRIALATVGTTGDVVPFVALGRGLTAAGHDVTAVSWELHREAFEGAASAFFAAGPPVSRQEIADTASRAAAAGSPLAQVAVLRDFHLRHAADHFQQLRDILPGHDLVVLHGIHTPRGGRRPRCRAGVGERGLRSGPAADRDGAAGRHAVARPVEPAGVVGARSDAAPPGQAAARRIGGCRQPHRHARSPCSAHDRRGCTWSAAHRVSRRRRPISRRSTHFTGAWVDPAPPAPLPADVERFIAAGTPPVVVTFGSMAAPDPAALASAVVSGIHDAGHRVGAAGRPSHAGRRRCAQRWDSRPSGAVPPGRGA